jgi:hypothetical protein
VPTATDSSRRHRLQPVIVLYEDVASIDFARTHRKIKS